MVKHLPLPMSFTPALGTTRSPILWATVAISSRVKLPRRVGEHSLPTSAKDKKKMGL
jgi:hypothetical protein